MTQILLPEAGKSATQLIWYGCGHKCSNGRPSERPSSIHHQQQQRGLPPPWGTITVAYPFPRTPVYPNRCMLSMRRHLLLAPATSFFASFVRDFQPLQARQGRLSPWHRRRRRRPLQRTRPRCPCRCFFSSQTKGLEQTPSSSGVFAAALLCWTEVEMVAGNGARGGESTARWCDTCKPVTEANTTYPAVRIFCAKQMRVPGLKRRIESENEQGTFEVQLEIPPASRHFLPPLAFLSPAPPVPSS